jgi:AcrR family transcriptional regulator
MFKLFLNNVHRILMPPHLPKLAADRRAALKQSLVEATRAIIGEHGLQAVKARDIAARAGCALGAIYQAFPDLDSLVLAANEGTLAEIEAHLASYACPEAQAMTRAGDPPELPRFLTLAFAYLDFAAGNRPCWRALFEHRMADGRPVPHAFSDRLTNLFLFIEEPLEGMRPDLSDEDRTRFARTLFSAVHGVVALGLEEKLASLSARDLRHQLGLVVCAMGRGLSLPSRSLSPKSPAARLPRRQRPGDNSTRS